MAVQETDPASTIQERADELHVRLSGNWTMTHANDIEAFVAQVLEEAAGRRVIFNLSGVSRLDTLGAWVLDRTRNELGEAGLSADFVEARPAHRILLDEVAFKGFQQAEPVRGSKLVDFLSDVGKSVVGAGKDVSQGTSFLGEVVVALGKVIINPQRVRWPSIVHHIEQIAFRGTPIILLISFLVGAIVAQQGIFQLQRFGATAFVVNLVGILVLRELGVLLTSIMVAGRSGSAFTAEIGSMKMREEIDALRVMGMSPVEVLILPRLIALIISLPILTFLSSMAALTGGGIVAWIYGGISPEVFLTRLQAAISTSTFFVGLIKAPFMALVIGMIASLEGVAVQGSAESLGRQVTSSVVKAIFMVIVLDGFFAIFFAAIDY